MLFHNTLEFSRKLDAEDTLAPYKEQFHFPKINGKKVIYFTGNSLGLQPKRTQAYIDEIMADWKELAVEGHFHALFKAILSDILRLFPNHIKLVITFYCF